LTFQQFVTGLCHYEFYTAPALGGGKDRGITNLDPVGYLMSEAAALKFAPTRLGTQGVNCPKALPNLTKL
jgi:hypothetical protein